MESEAASGFKVRFSILSGWVFKCVYFYFKVVSCQYCFSPFADVCVYVCVCVCVAQPAALFLILPAPLSHDPGGAVHAQGEAAGGGDHVSSCRLPRPDSRPAPLPAPPEAGTHKLDLSSSASLAL